MYMCCVWARGCVQRLNISGTRGMISDSGVGKLLGDIVDVSVKFGLFIQHCAL